MIGLNVGSGQRPFGKGWINLDIQVAEDRMPNVQADMFHLPFRDGSVDMVVSSHTLEHLGCGEACGFIKESYRVLKSRGSLIVSIPDIRALAKRWLTGQIDEYIYLVNMMGAWMGDMSDLHRWHYTKTSLTTTIFENGIWEWVREFDNRPILGMDLASDWWILILEAYKK